MYLHKPHNDYWTARGWFLDEEIRLPVEVLNNRAEQVVNTINHAYRTVLRGARNIYPIGTMEVDPTLIVDSARNPLKADPTDEQMAPTVAVIGKENAATLKSLAETAITTFRSAHELLIKYGRDSSREHSDAWKKFLDANYAFFKFAQQLVHVLTEAHSPTRRAELEKETEDKRGELYSIADVLSLYEAARRMYSMPNLGLSKSVLEKLAERTIATIWDGTRQAAVDPWSGETFVDGENWPVFKAVTRALVAAFWRYHHAIVTPGSQILEPETFNTMLEMWKVHEDKQVRRTNTQAILAEQDAYKSYYSKLSVQPRQAEEDVDSSPLADELDRGDVLYMPPLPSSALQISKAEVRE